MMGVTKRVSRVVVGNEMVGKAMVGREMAGRETVGKGMAPKEREAALRLANILTVSYFEQC